MKSNSGLTLVELLVAITISAILGVGAVQLFQTVSGGSEKLNRQQFLLDQLRRGMNKIETDIVQLNIQRDVKDEYGDTKASLVKDFDHWLEFTRSGWEPSLAIKFYQQDQQEQSQRSELQRVSYRLEPLQDEICSKTVQVEDKLGGVELEGECLVRSTTFHLDSDGNEERFDIALIGYLSEAEVKVFYVNPNNELKSSEKWPIDNASGLEIMKYIEFTFSHQRFGEIKRLFIIPERLNSSTGPGNPGNGNGNS